MPLIESERDLCICAENLIHLACILPTRTQMLWTVATARDPTMHRPECMQYRAPMARGTMVCQMDRTVARRTFAWVLGRVQPSPEPRELIGNYDVSCRMKHGAPHASVPPEPSVTVQPCRDGANDHSGDACE